MKTEEYKNICKLSIYKKLTPSERHIYGTLNMLDCSFGNKGNFYKSRKDLCELTNFNKGTISRAKQKLIFYGFIKVNKFYNHHGNRGSDNFTMCSLKDILETLKKDINSNKSDINRISDLTKA